MIIWEAISLTLSIIETGNCNKCLGKEYGNGEKRENQNNFWQQFFENETSNIEEAILKCSQDQIANNVSTNDLLGVLVRTSFALLVGFDASGIVGAKICGEAVSVDDAVIKEWISRK